MIVVLAERPTATEPAFIGSEAHLRLEGYVEASIPHGLYLLASAQGGWDGAAAQAQATALLTTLRAARAGAPLAVVALGSNVARALGLDAPERATWWKGIRLAYLVGLENRAWWARADRRQAAWALWRQLEAVGP